MLSLGRAIANGFCPDQLAFKKPPIFSVCRWLSSAIRLQLLYISTKKPTKELISLLHIVQQIYIPMWFRIRIKNSWDNGSRHLFAFLESARAAVSMCGDETIIKTARVVMVNNGYFTHSENMLLSMITDNDPGTRQEGYSKIIKIRINNKLSDQSPTSLRTFKKPKEEDYDFEARRYQDMLRLEHFTCEPPFTQRMELALLEKYARANHKLSVPAFKCHTQDTERTVALMASCVSRIPGLAQQNALMMLKYHSRKRNGRIVKQKYQSFNEQKRKSEIQIRNPKSNCTSEHNYYGQIEREIKIRSKKVYA